MANPVKPWGQRPYDPTWADQSNTWGDWVTSALNQLIGQGNPTQGKGFPSLSVPVVDPTTNQIPSAGSRMSSVATPITWIASIAAGVATVTFYWDGTNGSQLLRIGRDDGTVLGPTPNGSPQAVGGLAPSTTYYFYPFWNEAMQIVHWATVPGVSVGTPSYAFTVQNFLAAQQQILRGNIPLGLLLVQTGVTTPASGTTTGSGGSGGGGAGSGGGRGPLQ